MDSSFRWNDGRGGSRLSLLLLRPGRPRSAPTGFPLGRGEDAEEKARQGRPRGCVLFGYFLLHKQEKVTPSQGCEGSSQGRESVLAVAPKVKNQSRWISGFRRNDEFGRLFVGTEKRKDRNWIPAVAGMTE